MEIKVDERAFVLECLCLGQQVQPMQHKASASTMKSLSGSKRAKFVWMVLHHLYPEKEIYIGITREEINGRSC